MGTEFTGFQPPPGDTIANYDRKLPYDEQPATVPSVFKEALSIREEVFVQEQKIAPENELDEDDARSYHWVVYASVGTSHSSHTASPEPEHKKAAGHSRRSSKDEQRRSSGSTASRVPVGTIRLVPPPHKHLTQNGPRTSQTGGNSAPNAPQWEPEEPYIKLGRLATLAPYRGLGLSRLLIRVALEWARTHPEEIVKPIQPSDVEAARLEGKKEQEPWDGLVIVHAQTQVEGVYTRFGFQKVEEMGTWWEEGWEHIGMQLKLSVNQPYIPMSSTSGVGVVYATPAHGIPDSAY
jgi:predicted GNAT family N-acyltransferase